MNDKVKGYYYKQQLTKAPNPNYQKDFFEVEKILKQKVVNNKTLVLVKYLYYPNKFNQWIPKKNISYGDK